MHFVLEFKPLKGIYWGEETKEGEENVDLLSLNENPLALLCKVSYMQKETCLATKQILTVSLEMVSYLHI